LDKSQREWNWKCNYFKWKNWNRKTAKRYSKMWKRSFKRKG